jgi:Na+/melibiose symporter-like transporter
LKTNHILSVKEKIGYGLGDTASNFYFQMYINFLLFFYTDVFGIPAAVAGTLFLLSRIWDGINDPLMGMIADRTNTRWGKFRPYLLWMMLPLAIIGVIMFTTPDLSVKGKIIYAYITYNLMMMAYTAINIPYSAMLGVLSPDTQQRTSASTYRFVLAFIGALVVQSATLPLVYSIGRVNQGITLTDHILKIQEINNRTSRIIVQADDGVNQTTNEFLINIDRKGEQSPIVKTPVNDMVFEQGFKVNETDISTVFSDADGDKLTYEVKSNNNDVVEAYLTDSILTLAEKGVGVSEIMLTAFDGHYGQTNAMFTVYVNAAGNHAPVLTSAITDTLFDLGTPKRTINLSGRFSDQDGDQLRYEAQSENGTAVSAKVSNAMLALQLYKVGISKIIVTASDNKGGLARDIFLVKCSSGKNDPPAVAFPLQNVKLAAGFGEYSLDLGGTFQDLDGDQLTYSIRKVDVAKGFQLTLVIYGLLACILFYFTFIMTRERVQPPKDQHTSMKNDLKDLVHNRPWMVLLVMGIFTLGYIIIRSGTIMYYFKYYIENELLASLFMVSGTAAVIAGVACTDFLSRILGKKKLYLIVMALSSILTMIFYFIPKEQIVLVFTVNIILQFIMAPQAPLLWAMYADTADYSEWKNGRRATGLIFSAATFAQKFGMALGGGLAGWLLAMFGFQANVQQTPETLHGICLMMSFIPAVGTIIATVFAFFYELDDKTMKKIEQDLAERKSQNELRTS